MSPDLVLLGPPGAAVPEIAFAVAAAWGVAAVDTDAEVERAAGRPAGEVLVDDGEAAFRGLERSAALAALAGPGVVALGGGAVLDPAVAEAVRTLAAAGVPVVFVDVSLADAVARLGFNQPRPLLPANPRAIWQAEMEARRPVYLDLATASVVVDGRSADQVAGAVLAGLGDPR